MSNRILPLWDLTYKADRRKHHHRCFICRRILADGDKATMVRVRARKTMAAHFECTKVSHPDKGTWRDIMREWAYECLLNSMPWDRYNSKDWPAIAKFRAKVMGSNEPEGKSE